MVEVKLDFQAMGLGVDKATKTAPDAAPPDQGDSELDEIEAYLCADCGAICEETGGPLYECGECGTRFTRDLSADGGSHRCPDCNKFSAKTGEEGCSECGQGEAQAITAYECPVCEDLVTVEDWSEHKIAHATPKGEA